jgi:hypothetical protein
MDPWGASDNLDCIRTLIQRCEVRPLLLSGGAGRMPVIIPTVLPAPNGCEHNVDVRGEGEAPR